MNKRNFTSVLLIIMLWSFAALNSYGQAAEISRPAESGESIELFTDRSVYTVSEKVYFSAFQKAPETGVDADWSTVLYIELINWDGAKLTQSKVSIENNAANGSMMIPANLESGIYYLRAYTKWMRNYSPYAYAYLPLRVINPFTRKINQGPETSLSAIEAVAKSTEKSGEDIAVNHLKAEYAKREAAALELEFPGGYLNGQYCVSISRMVEEPQAQRSMSFVYRDSGEANTDIEYLPEINGLSLSGTVVEKASREPAEGIKVNLSSYSSSFYYSATRTSTDGSFVFTLPHYNGTHEMHLAIENDSTGQYEVLLRSEFCNQPVNLPYIPFQLSESERKGAEQMIFNAQVCYKFSPDDSVNTEDQLATAFYGKPPTVILEKDFIELNNLQEFFYELVYNVSVAFKNRKPYLVVHGETSLVSYPPLLLMDNIPVKNDEELLSIPCKMIERVEVINSGYIVGDFKYNGIISIFSTNRDMAGLEQNENKNFFNYQLFDDDVKACPMDVNTEQSSLPDRRNLLYWNPDLSLSEDHQASISFRTPDVAGEYVISIRGIDPGTGTLMTKQLVFSVN